MYDRRGGASSFTGGDNVVSVAPSGGGGGRTSTLVLTKVRAEDSGKFICVAENRAGVAEANFTLQVSESADLMLYLSSFIGVTVQKPFFIRSNRLTNNLTERGWVVPIDLGLSVFEKEKVISCFTVVHKLFPTLLRCQRWC